MIRQTYGYILSFNLWWWR